MSRPPVPYVTAWSAEQAPVPPVIRALAGIGFAAEQPGDRDRYGVLWRPWRLAPGRGTPVWGDVHALRQRLAMRRMLCQVCGGPADRDQDGRLLWLLEDDRGRHPRWPEDELTTHPPVCAPCAAVALKWCPYLRRGAVAVRVGTVRVDAVHGVLYAPGADGRPVSVETTQVRRDDPLARWVLAGQLAATLADCTIVDLPPPDGSGGGARQPVRAPSAAA